MAWNLAFTFRLIATKPLNQIVWRFQIHVWNDDHLRPGTVLNLGQVITLLIQQICANGERYLYSNFVTTFLESFFLDDA